MSIELQPIDITNSAEPLDLAEEVRRSGVGRLLKRGDQNLALLMPATPRQEPRPQAAGEERDALLNIIGIGESTEPTDIAGDAQAVLDGLRQSRGALKGVDIEALLADLDE